MVASVGLAEVLDIAMLKPELQARDANGNVITQGVEIVPAVINAYVVVERTQLSKKVNVAPQFTGVIEPGYIAGETVIEPAQVTILGIKPGSRALMRCSPSLSTLPAAPQISARWPSWFSQKEFRSYQPGSIFW